ncbi:MAG: hypothetical protein KAT56_04825 [Sedimentisphaerales bacterium]|nr:hypothetical protein [Sedimentisphaerales bacterium]
MWLKSALISSGSGGEGKDVCPGIIFPKRPKDKKRMELIESLFIEEGIPSSGMMKALQN